MDVMRPEIVWIAGSAFRRNTKSSMKQRDVEEPIADEPEVCDQDDDHLASAVDIEEHRGQFRARLDVPEMLYGSLIGKAGRSRQQVEQQTRCRVSIPRGAKSRAGLIEVTGGRRAAVRRACHMLLLAADRGRQRIPPTHFVAVRLTGVRPGYSAFRDTVLQRCGARRGVRPELFQNADLLHLTVCLMTLLSETERGAAGQQLEQVCQLVRQQLPETSEGGMAVSVAGLDIMNDDPSEARVLFARLQDAEGSSGWLQQLADSVLKGMVTAGMAREERQSDAGVKLHCTLMNTSYLVRDLPDSHPDHKQLLHSTFDATDILQQFGDFDFGTVVVKSLEIVQRRSFGEDKFYTPIAQIHL